MVDQTDPFTNPDTTTQPAVDPFADQLKGITNSDGNPKYDTVDKALAGLSHAQSHITTLETEAAGYKNQLAELQAELDKRGSVEEVVSRLTASAQNQPQAEPQDTPPQVVGLDEKAALDLITNVLTQKEQETALSANLNKVNSTLNQVYGDKVAEVVAVKAKELGTTPQDLKELSKTKPELVLSLFNSAKPTGPTPTTNSYNVQTRPQQTPELIPPTKSLLAGATSKEQAAYMDQVRASTYAKHGIEE